MIPYPSNVFFYALFLLFYSNLSFYSVVEVLKVSCNDKCLMPVQAGVYKTCHKKHDACRQHCQYKVNCYQFCVLLWHISICRRKRVHCHSMALGNGGML